MFARLWSWWRLRRLAKTRNLFTFWDGLAFRSIDPLKAWLVLRDHPQFNITTHTELAAEKLTQPELGWMVAAITEAFGVQEYDPATGKGLVLEELIDLFADLLLWLEDNQKKTGGSLTPLTHTAPESPTGPESTAEDTKSSSPWSTPLTEPNCAERPTEPSPTSHPPEQCCP